jgi:hypothetical protein
MFTSAGQLTCARCPAPLGTPAVSPLPELAAARAAQEGKVLSERLRRAQDQNVQAEMELEALRQARARLQRLLAQVAPRAIPATCPRPGHLPRSGRALCDGGALWQAAAPAAA